MSISMCQSMQSSMSNKIKMFSDVGFTTSWSSEIIFRMKTSFLAPIFDDDTTQYCPFGKNGSEPRALEIIPLPKYGRVLRQCGPLVDFFKPYTWLYERDPCIR